MPVRVANAPVSWGIMESLEPPAEFPFSRVLDEIAQAGYAGTELGPYGFLPTDPKILRQELNKRGLTPCSAFVAFHLGDSNRHTAGLEHVNRSAELIRQVGARLLILSDEITPERSAVAGRRDAANRLSWDREGWNGAKKAIGEVIKRCRELGLAVAFHHHVGTHVETPEEVDHLFSLFSPDDLGLCLDTGHCTYGGGYPEAVLASYADRVRCLHLKDVDAERLAEARQQQMDFYAAVRHGVFTPLGSGQVNFPRLLAHLQERGFDGWVVVEQDVLAGGAGATTPLANARAGRQYLRSLGF